MATVSHEPARRAGEHEPSWSRVLTRDMWASLAIIVIWLAVLFDALYGPNIVSMSGAGTDSSTVPSAIVVAPFAFLGTWVVAAYGFRSGRGD